MTVTTVGCTPPATGSPSLRATKPTPDWAPVNASEPWFDTALPLGAGGVTTTRKRTSLVIPMSISPPAVAFAPVPSRATTVREPGTQSIWSSPAPSDFGPAFGPLTICIEPGT